MTNKKTIVVACIVNIWLYKSAFNTLPFGAASCKRMSTASSPPTMKKNSAAAEYMIPSFLWSTVNSHDFQPVDATGRLSAPSDVLGVATENTSVLVIERSMMAMILPVYFSVNK